MRYLDVFWSLKVSEEHESHLISRRKFMLESNPGSKLMIESAYNSTSSFFNFSFYFFMERLAGSDYTACTSPVTCWPSGIGQKDSLKLLQLLLFNSLAVSISFLSFLLSLSPPNSALFWTYERLFWALTLDNLSAVVEKGLRKFLFHKQAWNSIQIHIKAFQIGLMTSQLF